MALTCHFGVINYYTLIKSETPVQGTASVVNCCLYCKKGKDNICVRMHVLSTIFFFFCGNEVKKNSEKGLIKAVKDETYKKWS